MAEVEHERKTRQSKQTTEGQGSKKRDAGEMSTTRPPERPPKQLDMDIAEEYKPPGAVMFDDVLAKRIRMFVGPKRRSVSSTYRTQSVHLAVTHVMNKGWLLHQEIYGEACPWKC